MKSITQLVSQVLPPSPENACSQRGVGVVTPGQIKTHLNGPSLMGAGAVEGTGGAGKAAGHRLARSA